MTLDRGEEGFLSSRLIDEKRVEREKEGSKGGDYGEDKDEE